MKLGTYKASTLVYTNFARKYVEEWLFGFQWALKQPFQRFEGRKLRKTNRQMQDSL